MLPPRDAFEQSTNRGSGSGRLHNWGFFRSKRMGEMDEMTSNGGGVVCRGGTGMIVDDTRFDVGEDEDKRRPREASG